MLIRPEWQIVYMRETQTRKPTLKMDALCHRHIIIVEHILLMIGIQWIFL